MWEHGPLSHLRRQALIEAPIETVWSLVGNPARFPDWVGDTIAVTGLATVEPGATFRQKSRLPLGGATSTSTFVIEAVEDFHEIHLRCLDSGWYARWLLTEARGGTFADVEIGLEPASVAFRAIDVTVGKRWHRRIIDQTLASLRAAAARELQAA